MIRRPRASKFDGKTINLFTATPNVKIKRRKASDRAKSDSESYVVSNDTANFFPEPDKIDEVVLTENKPNMLEVYRPILRDYQDMAKDSVLWAFNSNNPDRSDKVYMLMATGCGKTTICSEIIRYAVQEQNKKVLVVCHQIEVIDQWLETLNRFGMTGLVEQANNRAQNELGKTRDIVVVACCDSMIGNRLLSWPENYFDLVIHDECDLSLSPSWSSIIDYFTCRHLGITATPDRLDGRTIFEVFPKEGYTYPISQAVSEGWLVRPVERFASHGTIDLSKLKITFGDFNTKQLSKIIENNISSLASASIPEMDGKPTIAYTPTVFTAQALSQAFNDLGVPAVAMYAKMPNDQRKQVFADFNSGKIQVICNCCLLTRAIDLPRAECVILARPTASRALYTQMVGRALRLFYDEATNYTKTSAKIINFAWKFQKKRHSLQYSLEMFADKATSPAVMDRARQIYAEQMADDKIVSEKPDKKELDPQEIIKLAEVQIGEEIKKRLEFKQQSLKIKVTELDPLALDILKVPQNPRTNFMSGQEVLPWQKQKLLAAGFEAEEVNKWDRQKAQRTVLEIQRRRTANLATWRQVRYMIKLGASPDEAQGFSFEEANAWIRANAPKNQSNYWARTRKK